MPSPVTGPVALPYSPSRGRACRRCTAPQWVGPLGSRRGTALRCPPPSRPARRPPKPTTTTPTPKPTATPTPKPHADADSDPDTGRRRRRPEPHRHRSGLAPAAPHNLRSDPGARRRGQDARHRRRGSTSSSHPPTIDDSACDAYLTRYPTLPMTTPQIRAAVPQFAWDAMYELGRATLARALFSKRQLFEVMVEFWSNHFNVTMPGRRRLGPEDGRRPRRHPQERARQVQRPAARQRAKPRDAART